MNPDKSEALNQFLLFEFTRMAVAFGKRVAEGEFAETGRTAAIICLGGKLPDGTSQQVIVSNIYPEGDDQQLIISLFHTKILPDLIKHHMPDITGIKVSEVIATVPSSASAALLAEIKAVLKVVHPVVDTCQVSHVLSDNVEILDKVAEEIEGLDGLTAQERNAKIEELALNSEHKGYTKH